MSKSLFLKICEILTFKNVLNWLMKKGKTTHLGQVSELIWILWCSSKSLNQPKSLNSTKISKLNKSYWTQPKLKSTKDSALYELSQSVWFQSKFFLSQPKSLQSTNVSELQKLQKISKMIFPQKFIFQGKFPKIEKRIKTNCH